MMKSLVNTASELSGDRSVKEACEACFIYQMDINTYEHRIQQKDNLLEQSATEIDELERKLKEYEEKYK